jgi:hypothetical protein
MVVLDFTIEPSFECVDDDAGDVAFIRAARSIGGRDTIKEYMACRLFPLLASFGLGEVEDSETPVLKITLPLPEFPAVKFLEEMNDHFRARVELATEDVVGS